jgi:hypothetical protein
MEVSVLLCVMPNVQIVAMMSNLKLLVY